MNPKITVRNPVYTTGTPGSFATEKMEVSGGAKPTAANPGGRVTAVLTPREGTEAAAEASRAASASATPLKMTPTLPSAGDKR